MSNPEIAALRAAIAARPKAADLGKCAAVSMRAAGPTNWPRT